MKNNIDKKWQTLDSKEIFKTNFFRMRKDRCRLPDGRVMPDYYVFEYHDWAHVIPLTQEGEVVLIKQYRHASGKTCIEVPGGALDSKSEDPKLAAIRELEEETGYVPDDIRLVGKHFPNPASQNNRLFTYVALGCSKLKETKLDPYEDIEVFTVSVPDLLRMVFDGEITHSLMLASVLKALPFLGYKVI